ncbi:MAG: peptidase MA family metallohydrolase [Myxococcota bacterium]
MALALLLGVPSPSAAHETGEPHAHGPTLPPPPEGYREDRRGEVLWVYPASAEGTVRDLQAAYAEAWPRITRDLGGGIDPTLVVRIGRNPEEMHALAPEGHPPPEYATGVAYPFGVVLLTLTAPETWVRPDLDKVLAHELSHVALRRAVGGEPLPRWFVEGLAVHHADEYSLARTRVLWQATVQRRLLPLRELDRRFPHHPREVSVAYAQATSLVSYLLEEADDHARLARLVRRLRAGESFEAALADAYGLSLEALEHEWRGWIGHRFRTLPLVLGGGTLWVLASLLLFVAYGRYKQRARRKLARWEQEEAAVDRAERAADDRLAETEDDERVVVYVSGDPPQGREPEVPTVRHDGRTHTLH